MGDLLLGVVHRLEDCIARWHQLDIEGVEVELVINELEIRLHDLHY